jgi:hypothetical protein
MAQPQPQPPVRTVYTTVVNPRSWLIVLAVVCYIIALVVGTGWVSESGKLADVLVFLSLGSALFAAGHIY